MTYLDRQQSKRSASKGALLHAALPAAKEALTGGGYDIVPDGRAALAQATVRQTASRACDPSVS